MTLLKPPQGRSPRPHWCKLPDSPGPDDLLMFKGTVRPQPEQRRTWATDVRDDGEYWGDEGVPVDGAIFRCDVCLRFWEGGRDTFDGTVWQMVSDKRALKVLRS